MISTTFFLYVIINTLTSNDRVQSNPWTKETSFNFK
jgi:hypothetical protein